jgi:hypothetical protein
MPGEIACSWVAPFLVTIDEVSPQFARSQRGNAGDVLADDVPNSIQRVRSEIVTGSVAGDGLGVMFYPITAWSMARGAELLATLAALIEEPPALLE